MTILKLVMIRHGESEANEATRKFKANSYNVRHDMVPLTEKGKEQARKTGLYIKQNIFKENIITVCMHSSMLRARETAINLNLIDDDLWSQESLVDERDPGSIQNILDPERKRKEFEEIFSVGMKNDYLNFRPNGGESVQDVVVRAEQFLSETFVF